MQTLARLTVVCLALSACTAPERIVPQPQVTVAERVSSRFASIEVLEVSLPTYAAGDTVALEAGGEVVISDALWADDPARAVTLSLARNLREITGAQIAPEPWPFDGFANARVDVRVEALQINGSNLRMNGVYFVADLDGGGRNGAQLFDLSAPADGTSAASLAAARAALVAELALAIAREGL